MAKEKPLYDIRELAAKWKDGTITPEEKTYYENWYHQFDDEFTEIGDNLATSSPELEKRIFAGLDKRLSQTKATKPRQLWPRIAAAASVIFILSASGYVLLHKKQASQQLAQNDVSPFSNQAILKTGHAKTITLDSTHNGLLASYANARITAGNNSISYVANQSLQKSVLFDTLQVPAGGKPYLLKLADGSAITVNVASMLRFPENLRGGKNEIELLSGEAYFQIRHNANAPLVIKAKNQTIEDIGTEFNVSTYNDEADSRTTLVEGAVKVNHKNLAPGQQAIVTADNLTIEKADVEQTTSWVHGYFRFNGEDIQTVMRQLARWYNIEVKYEGPISKEGYYAKITRSKNISEVLRVLERTNKVHFKIEGRRVTVSSKK